MYPTQSNYGRGSRPSSFFLRLLHCKRTCAKRRRFFVNNYRSPQYHHVELGQSMERIEDKKSKSLNVNNVPLNEEDQKSWLEFKKIDEGQPVLGTINSEIANKAKRPIKVDHPFVPVIGDFAIGAFNELCEMHVKRDESNNLRHHEVMECKYLKHLRYYCFYMTIEAIEEGILGVYETIVACNPTDGRRTLIEFSHSNRKPIGKIAKRLPHLICLKSKYKTMKGMKKDIEIKLKTNHATTKDFLRAGMNKGKVTTELISLKQRHKAMKGVCNLLYQNIFMQIPTSWNERSNPDGWCIPNDHTSGLRWRCHDATCKGYNYNTPSKGWPSLVGW